MGQICCKDCVNQDRYKKSAIVSWHDDDDYDDHNTYSTGAISSLKSSPTSINDTKRSNRIKNKKRNVTLHAEFRDRHNLLAPPLVTEGVMVDTDNVFTGQDLGVHALYYNTDSSSNLFGDIPQDSSYESTTVESASEEELNNNILVLRKDDGLKELNRTMEEDIFLDRALSDDDNFVFDGLSDHFRKQLKDSMERVLVPKNTVLIRKGDTPDYLYLILEGEVAVYISPDEYVDDTAMDLGKHAPIEIPLNKPKTQPFRQSYVLNLRKSLFSMYKESIPEDTKEKEENNNKLVGQVLSLVRESGASTLTGEEQVVATSAGDDDDIDTSFIPLNTLKGLKHERDLGQCDVFGELGLIYHCERTASCLTKTECILYRLDGEIFRSILASSNADRVKKRCTESRAALLSLHNIGLLEDLDEKTLDDFEEVLNPITFEQDDLVITKGTYDKMLFFIMSGKVLVHDIGTGDSCKADIELGVGGHFGESNLFTNRPSIANATVLSKKARLMAITKQDYLKRHKTLHPLVRRLGCRNALLSIPVISKSKLLPQEINSLVHKFEKVSFAKGKISFSGSNKSAIYIIVTGRIQMVMSDGDGGSSVFSFDQFDHFGGKSLFDQTGPLKTSVRFFDQKGISVRAIVPTECYVLTRESIVKVIGNINRLGTPSLPFSRKLIKGIKRNDLILHRILGVGRVWLVQHCKSSKVYAMKAMSKKDIIGKKMIKAVTREKNVMASIEHPFISNLVSTFQDQHTIYLLLDYVQGGELFGLIYNVSKKGYLSNDAAAFYGACLCEALHHLHSRNICHRDIKPENVLINSDGYIVLVDFGFSKIVLDKTFTTCGSPEYMAPEMLLGKGHTLSIDHYALGVLIYEMLVGQTPFIHVGATRLTLFRRIANGKFAFPSQQHGITVCDEAKLLIRGLLNKDCTKRIGSSLTQGDEEISSNTWFQGLLTEYREAFLAEKVSPPWIPNIDDELDASYFGSHDKLEKEMLSKKRDALDKKSQALFAGF